MRDSILVTGGAGFIGGCFVRRWVEREQATVVNLDKLTYAGNLDSLAEAREHPRHVFVRGDVCDGELITRLLEEHEPRAIVHFAAESHVDRSIDNPREFIDTNILGAYTLLERATTYWRDRSPADRASFRFLNVSTDEVYGSAAPGEVFHETTAFAPNSPYAASKASAAHLGRAYHRTYELPVMTTFCANNYGPYQFPEKLIPLMTLNALEGKRLPVYGDGMQERDWLHVADHSAALELLLEQGEPGEAYNVGADRTTANLEIVNSICDQIDRRRPELPHAPCRSLIEFVTDRPGHDRRYALDSSKLRALGWRPQYELDAGLEATVAWYLDNPGWVERVTSGVYQRERLGVSGTSPE